jgi:hypothetical protein
MHGEPVDPEKEERWSRAGRRKGRIWRPAPTGILSVLGLVHLVALVLLGTLAVTNREGLMRLWETFTSSAAQGLGVNVAVNASQGWFALLIIVSASLQLMALVYCFAGRATGISLSRLLFFGWLSVGLLLSHKAYPAADAGKEMVIAGVSVSIGLLGLVATFNQRLKIWCTP